jgi:hypothetical protein
MMAAATVAGVLASSAQVYSANVVGYVTKAYPVAYNFYMGATPLDTGNNSLTNLFPTAPSGTTIYTWNGGIQDLDAVAVYSKAGSGWVDGNSANANSVKLNPGVGYFVSPGAAWTNTFVGDVMQGSLTNATPVLGNYAFTALGSMVPVGGSITNVMAGYAAVSGDTFYPWNAMLQDLDTGSYSYTGTKWVDDYTANAVGDGFFYSSAATSSKTWIRDFTVQ